MLLHIFALLWAVASGGSEIGLRNCPEKCGNVTIPYPFGIGDGCFYNNKNSRIADSNTSIYSVKCSRNGTDPPRTYIGNDIELVKITVDGELWVPYPVAYNCSAYNSSGQINEYARASGNLKMNDYARARFTLSLTKNSLLGYGCAASVWFVFEDYSIKNRYQNMPAPRSRCQTSSCGSRYRPYNPRSPYDYYDGYKTDLCPTGFACCQASITDGKAIDYIQAYRTEIRGVQFTDWSNPYHIPCRVGFAVANDAIPNITMQYLAQNYTFFDKLQYPVVYDWWITGTGNCETARASQNCICKGNSPCIDVNNRVEKGYRCQCNPGFEGNNPYAQDCQDVDECLNGRHSCNSPAICVNTVGSYNCVSTDRRYKLLAGLSVTFGSIPLLLMGWWLYKLMKRRQAIKKRGIHYEKYLLLQQQQLPLGEGVVERTKIFTVAELRKATDNFSEDRILGQGGHGTVYKGMLNEGKIVAVKKPRRLEESEIKEFINEVAILSQINHRNIVKLLGCCLETEVPLLVFEFIPNGTLFHHIHYPSEEFPITWKMRLQIASDSAGALAYLHYSSSIPIFHRDIKSSNILLDEKYRGKLSDFGTSRLVDVDQTHVTTRVMGTFGYLDPEYFQSQQFTEKSDVYSFGVVLVELLTGQKAIRAISEQDRSLTSWFLSHMENSRLLDIIDSQVLKENCNKEEFHTIATLAKRCLNVDGKRRPSMKEVLLEIEAVLSLHLPQMNEPNTPTKADQVFVTGAMEGSISDYASSSSTFYLESKSLSSDEASLLFTPR